VRTLKRDNPEGVVKDQTNPTMFGAPVVSSAVTDPTALKYARDAVARSGARYSTPVAGGPPPPIPRLDAPAAENLTMADQANLSRLAAQHEGTMPTGIFGGGGMPAVGPSKPFPTAPTRPNLFPSDVLPEEARQDPAFREGQGSMYASSQPELAYKYGVIRNGARIPPQALGQPRKGLSGETVAGLQAIQELQKAREKVEGEDSRIAQESQQTSAGAAGRYGNAPTDGPANDPDTNKKTIEEAVKKLDDFDFNTFREMMLKDILNNDEQRKIIEERCKPLDITDLILKGYATQLVPIIPGKFEPEFQSMSGLEDLAIKQLIMEEGKTLHVNERYLLDKFSLMGVVVGVRSINNQVLPDHRVNGKFNPEAFWVKFDLLTRYPFHLLASLGVNYYWFDLRVRKLFVAEKIKNG
jgi:hypothetical protein